jgi:hypothetical protein
LKTPAARVNPTTCGRSLLVCLKQGKRHINTNASIRVALQSNFERREITADPSGERNPLGDRRGYRDPRPPTPYNLLAGTRVMLGSILRYPPLSMIHG